MDVVTHIRDLLYTHEYVIIPGFGGFLAKPTSAKIHPTQHTFQPPGKRIAFNQRLKEDDGLLVNHIVHEENISQKKATQRVNNFVRQVKQDLDTKHLVILPQIGKLHYDIEKNLQFSPNRTVNYALSSFGLPDFQFYPIQRKRKKERSTSTTFSETTKATTMSKKSTKKEAEKKKKRNVLTPVLVGIVLLLGIVLGLHYFVPGFQVHEKWQAVTSSIFPIPDTSEQEQESVDDTSATQEGMTADTGQSTTETTAADTGQKQASPPGQDTATKQPEQEAMAQATKTKDDQTTTRDQTQNTGQASTGKSGGYYIVIGSFEQVSNAERLARQIRNNGRSVEVLPSGKGFHRVGLGRFEKQEAMNRLEDLRDRYNPYAWVLKK